MIKKQQKWIALIVAVTFMWLLQVSNMSLNAAGSSEQVSSANAEQGPDYYEAIAQKVAPAKKKSILPWILIGVGVVAVTAVLFLVVLKTSYDITGTWTFIFTHEATTETDIFTFSGTKANGNFVHNLNPTFVGTYQVDGKNVTMTLTYHPSTQFSGQFNGKDTMTGTLIDTDDGNEVWNFTATRGTMTASLKPTPAAQSKLFSK